MGGLIKLHLTTEERADLVAEAERRGLSLPDMVSLVVARQAPRMSSRLRVAKSNGWHPGREAFLVPTGIEPQPPKRIRQSKGSPDRQLQRQRPAPDGVDQAERLTEVIRKLLSEETHWRGTSTELIERLSDMGAAVSGFIKRQIKSLRPTLLQFGIVISESRTGSKRLLILERVETKSVIWPKAW